MERYNLRTSRQILGNSLL